MPDARTVLLDHLARYAYKFSPEKQFLLASGVYSDEYLDCKLALSQPAAMAALGRVFLDYLPRGVDAIGGLTMGADPIVMSTALVSASTDRPVRWFLVRKEGSKAHGQKKLIEGSVTEREPVAVVDDVVTSGSSTIKAIEACRGADLNVAQVIVLVDRQQDNGMANIRDAAGQAIPVVSVFTKDDIKKRWLEQNPTRLTLVKTG
jgi:orotate phosphoribosyltransferase